jgi:hypothetical protein
VLKLRHGEGEKMTKKSLVLRGILVLILTTSFDVLFLRYCYNPLLNISFYLAVAFYLSLSILIATILTIVLFTPGKISKLFGKDMKQTLIDHGNITA